MEFLVNIAVKFPSQLDDAARGRLIKTEMKRALELVEEGILIKLWRVPGRVENWGVWRADGPTELDRALRSLPLFRFLQIDVIALAAHPLFPDIKKEKDG